MEKHFLSDFFEGTPIFQPKPRYNADGDSIHYKVTDEAACAERIDSFLTLYRSADDNRVIGFQIKGISAILEKYGAKELAIASKEHPDKSISVVAIFFKALKAGEREPTADQYEEIVPLLQHLHGNRIPISIH
jgi:hypothetical protein